MQAQLSKLDNDVRPVSACRLGPLHRRLRQALPLELRPGRSGKPPMLPYPCQDDDKGAPQTRPEECLIFSESECKANRAPL